MQSKKKLHFYRVSAVPSLATQSDVQGSEKEIHQKVNEDEKEKIEGDSAVISKTPLPLQSHENEKKDEVCIFLHCCNLIAKN